jgi:hypothetical protein
MIVEAIFRIRGDGDTEPKPRGGRFARVFPRTRLLAFGIFCETTLGLAMTADRVRIASTACAALFVLVLLLLTQLSPS